jgi:hypothetical protein
MLRLLYTPFVLSILLLGLAPSALAQQGDGIPVKPSPWVAVSIDEQNACVRTGEAPRATAEQLCGDWNHEQFPAFRAPNETVLLEARLQCINFYRLALRMQNIFCSYGIDVARFHASSTVEAQKEHVGEQNVSQHAVAADNRTVAGINKKYMERIAAVGKEFHEAYPAYISSIGRVNSRARFDKMREANCFRQTAASNMDLTSPIPGFVREALAAHSQATAYTTYNYVISYTRENYANLKEVREEAERNAQRAEMNEMGIPAHFERTINAGGTGASTNNALTPAEGAIYGAFQTLITDGIKKKFPHLPGPGASIIGGGLVIAWQYHQNKTIPYAETAATFIGMLNPYAGLAANVLVGAYRTSEQTLKNYHEFCKVELKNNSKLTAPELVTLWGRKQNKPEAAKLCEDSAKLAAQCVIRRAQGIPAYSGDNCALPPSERAEEQQRQQRITQLKRKLGIR